MILNSIIGEPLISYSLTKQEWKKGDKIDGFIIPFNLFDNVHGLFRRFNLWQSSNGVCTAGVLHSPFQRVNNFVLNVTPIFVGDKLQNHDQTVYVTSAINKYLKERKMWSCSLEFGHLPEPQIPENPQAISLLKNLNTTDEKIVNFVCNFFDSFLREILPACQVATQIGLQPIQPNLALAQLAALKEKMKTQMQDILSQTQESLWY